jgi:hypothetical protein
MSNVLKGHAPEFVMGVADDLAKAFVHLQQFAVQATEGATRGSLMEERAEPLFAFREGLVGDVEVACGHNGAHAPYYPREKTAGSTQSSLRVIVRAVPLAEIHRPQARRIPRHAAVQDPKRRRFWH